MWQGVAMHRLFIVCILLISTLFSSAGLFIPISQLPGFLRWMRHINPMKYSNDLVSGVRLSYYSGIQRNGVLILVVPPQIKLISYLLGR